MVISNIRALLRLQSEILPRTESITSSIGHISFGKKLPGKRSAGKSHAAFDVADDGNRINYLITAPLFDPTCKRLVGKFRRSTYPASVPLRMGTALVILGGSAVVLIENKSQFQE